MFPRSSNCNVADRRFAYAEQEAKFSMRPQLDGQHASDLKYARFCQPGDANSLTANDSFGMGARSMLFSRSHPALGRRIRQVIRRGPGKEVVGANTEPVIAMVADKQTAWNRAFIEKPRYTMGVLGSGFAVNPESTVAAPRYSAPPKPAGFSFQHLGPEALRQRLASWTGMSHFLRRHVQSFCSRLTCSGGRDGCYHPSAAFEFATL